ncbi:hypothetical protein [Pararhodonellum marinum]|nr:hypothetical protein [Pararhodonellum marinum]
MIIATFLPDVFEEFKINEAKMEGTPSLLEYKAKTKEVKKKMAVAEKE